MLELQHINLVVGDTNTQSITPVIHSLFPPPYNRVPYFHIYLEEKQYHIADKSIDSGAQSTSFESRFCHLLAVIVAKSYYLASLCHSL